jgi:cytidyltransferase-like protein
MIVNLENLADIREQHANEKLVLTSGTFDMLHIGHLRYLEAVKALGDIVVVMLSGDARTKARKGSERPIIPEKDRAQLLDALKIVDYVFIDPATKPPDEIDPIHAKIIHSLNPDLYATDGEDPRFFEIMDKSKLLVLPRSHENISTSEIISRLSGASTSLPQ